MDIYATIMYCLSLFGFFILFFSFYLLIFVPTKLNNFTRFAIHGHDFTSAIYQLYLTLGCTPTILFPCATGYMSGFLSNFGMEPLDQIRYQVTLFTISRSFSLLLTINRTFAVNAWMKKHKNPILIMFFVQLIGQVVFLLIKGFNTKYIGEDERQTCLERLIHEFPEGMDAFRGYDLSSKIKTGVLASLYTGLVAVIHVIVAVVCVCILVQSIREQAKSSQSTQFLANQRRITVGIIYFMIVEAVGLSLPSMINSGCLNLRVGNTAVSHYVYISISIYPIFGPYYILMSNTDYRNKVKGILKKVIEQIRTFFSAGNRKSYIDHVIILLLKRLFTLPIRVH